MPTLRDLRLFNIATHRDLGYLVSSLLVAYCVSGLALNHADIWNPDFVIHKTTVEVPVRSTTVDVTPSEVDALGRLVGENHYRVYDFPTRDQMKIYYESATLHVDFVAGVGQYERVARRPIFYQVDVLHRNSLKAWRWAADVLAVLLIVVNVTGLFVLRGAQGLGGRGKWLILAGATPAIVALVWHGLRVLESATWFASVAWWAVQKQSGSCCASRGVLFSRRRREKEPGSSVAAES